MPDVAGSLILGIKSSPGGLGRGETSEGQDDSKGKKDAQKNDFRQEEGDGQWFQPKTPDTALRE